MSKGSKKSSAGTRRSKKRTTAKKTKKPSRRSAEGTKPTAPERDAGGRRTTGEGAAYGDDATTGDGERIYAFADQLSEARQKQEPAEPEERPESWVSFVLGEEIYALPVSSVHEILRVGQITRVPHAPSSVLGVCNRRGRVLPIVDLRSRLGLEARPTSAAARIVVVSSAGRLLGLLVDSVRQVEAVPRSQVQPAPESVTETCSGAVEGVVQQHGRTIVLLELASLLQLGRSIGEKIA